MAPQPSAAPDGPGHTGRGLPDGAVDVHAHVMTGSTPAVPGAVYQPFEAPVERFLAHLDRVGLSRGVLVNPSVYGHDHEVLLDALRAHPDRLRGVAVVTPEHGDAVLDRLHRAGVRGARVQDHFTGGVPVSGLAALQHRIEPMGWHVEVFTDPLAHRDALAAAAARGRVLLDHLGSVRVPDAAAPDPGIPVLLDLLAAGDCWVTLSGAYRLAVGLRERDAAGVLHDRVHAVLDAAPDRVVWGSDWPHVAPPGPVPTPEDVESVLDLWLSDPDVRRRVLVDNPRRLYRWHDLPDASAR
jgi:2-pyrone-4,6-dicarboxylate lactonase